MRLQFIGEPRLAFHQNNTHVDIRAGLSTYGAFDKGGISVPTPIRLGVIGTTRHGRRRSRLAGTVQKRSQF
jgi:hypothetical protein